MSNLCQTVALFKGQERMVNDINLYSRVFGFRNKKNRFRRNSRVFIAIRAMKR